MSDRAEAEAAHHAVHDTGLSPGFRERWPHITLTDYVSLLSRIGVTTIFVILYALGQIDTDERGRLALIVGLGLFLFAAVLSAVTMLVFKWHPRTVLRTLFLPDLVSSALIIYATGMHQDPLYPWMIGLAIVYGAGLPLREASGFTIAVGITYLVGHLAGRGATHAAHSIPLIVFNTLAIIITALFVSNVSRRQAYREARLRKSQREYHDLNKRLSRRLSDLRAISEITDLIHSTLDFEQVGQLVLEIMSKLIDLQASALFVIDKKRDRTLFSATFGMQPGTAAKPGEPFVPEAVTDGHELFACTMLLERAGLMVIFCAPGDALEHLTKDDQMVLSSVANDLVVAVENSELYKLTKRLSITDELTGLFNYRHMLERLDDELERAKRFGRSVSMLMLDADEFKGYNDTHGHIAGDAALAELAVVLRSAVRDIDVVCRFGGEEFTVLLPETDAEGAFVVAEKVREAVAAHSFPNAAGAMTERLTASIGVATYPSTAADREELLRQADDALYTAKHTGRNRVSATPQTASTARGRRPALAQTADKGDA